MHPARRRARSRIASTLAFFLIFSATAVGLAGSASAAGPGCPPGNLCLYTNNNAGGILLAFTGKRGYLGQFATIAKGYCKNNTWNDCMSSWRNLTGVRYCWYFDLNYSPQAYIMEPYSNGRVVNLTPAENDKASSVRPC